MSKPEEKKEAFVPDATGTVPVSGMEKAVARLRVLLEHAKLEGEEIAVEKARFREEARSILDAAGEAAKRVLFRGPAKEGGGLEVSLPDYSKKGSRPKLSDSTWKALTRAGGAEALVLAEKEAKGEEAAREALDGLLEKEVVCTLRGPWVTEWLKPYLEGLAAQGVGLPDGWEQPVIEEEVRVRAAGIPRLKELARSENRATAAVAKLLLEKGLRDLRVEHKK